MQTICRTLGALAAGLVAVTLFFASDAASAGAAVQARRLINVGMDIRPDGTSVMVPFYDGQPGRGGDDGATMNASRTQLDVSIPTPGLAGSTIHGFDLFVDAEDVQGSDSVHLELFRSGAGYARILTLGYPGKQADVPVEGGPLGKHRATPYKQDRAPNTLLLSSPPAPSTATVRLPLTDYAGNLLNGFFRLRLRFVTPKGKSDARIDGVNLQIEFTPAASGS